jgi:hypothetical protein
MTPAALNAGDCICLFFRVLYDSFIEWFQNNQVVTEISHCLLGSRTLSALRGNHSVKKLMIRFTSSDLGNEEMYALLESLPGNIGIEHLSMYNL